MKARFVFTGMVLCAIALPTLAQAPPGKSPIDSAHENLAAGMPEQARLNYRARLERAFLENGISADVYVEETGKPGSGAYPRLIIWTFLTKAIVYKLITKDKILDDAKAAGFKMVQFTDKGRDGQWFFDLTKPGSCDRGLCWTN